MEGQTQSERYPRISSAPLAWNLAPVSSDMVNTMDRLSFIFSDPTLEPIAIDQEKSSKKSSDSLKRKHGDTSSTTSSREGSKVASGATNSVADNDDDDDDDDSNNSESDNGEYDSDDSGWKTMSQARRHFARKRAEEAKIPETPLGLTDIITAFRGNSECIVRGAES
jgi:hypothetical protein